MLFGAILKSRSRSVQEGTYGGDRGFVEGEHEEHGRDGGDDKNADGPLHELHRGVAEAAPSLGATAGSVARAAAATAWRPSIRACAGPHAGDEWDFGSRSFYFYSNKQRRCIRAGDAWGGEDRPDGDWQAHDYSAMAFEKSIRKHLKLKQTAIKLESEVEDMRNRYLHYPPGTRPFRSPEEQTELDEPLKVSGQQEWNFQVKIEASTSRRTAMHLVHHALTVFVKQCYLEGAHEVVERTKGSIEKKLWYEKVEDLWKETTKKDEVAELGLEQPMTKDLNREVFLQKAEELYGRVIQHVYKDEKLRKDEQEAKAEEEKILKKNIEANSPDVLIKDLIDQRLEERMERITKSGSSGSSTATGHADRTTWAKEKSSPTRAGAPGMVVEGVSHEAKSKDKDSGEEKLWSEKVAAFTESLTKHGKGAGSKPSSRDAKAKGRGTKSKESTPAKGGKGRGKSVGKGAGSQQQQKKKQPQQQQLPQAWRDQWTDRWSPHQGTAVAKPLDQARAARRTQARPLGPLEEATSTRGDGESAVAHGAASAPCVRTPATSCIAGGSCMPYQLQGDGGAGERLRPPEQVRREVLRCAVACSVGLRELQPEAHLLFWNSTACTCSHGGRRGVLQQGEVAIRATRRRRCSAEHSGSSKGAPMYYAPSGIDVVFGTTSSSFGTSPSGAEQAAVLGGEHPHDHEVCAQVDEVQWLGTDTCRQGERLCLGVEEGHPEHS